MRLVAGDGELVPTVVPMGVLPVASTTATTAMAVEELQRAWTGVGLP